MADGVFERAGAAMTRAATEVVEDALAVLGHGPGTCLMPDPGALAAWLVPHGRRAVVVRLLAGQTEPIVRVAARVLRITASVPQTLLYRRLLERNERELRGTALAIDGDEVILLADRSAPELDGQTLLTLIESVDTLGGRLGRVLADELGGSAD